MIKFVWSSLSDRRCSRQKCREDEAGLPAHTVTASCQRLSASASALEAKSTRPRAPELRTWLQHFRALRHPHALKSPTILPPKHICVSHFSDNNQSQNRSIF